MTVSVHELRDALGDDSRDPHYIETQARKGYRFIARVTATSAHDFPTRPDCAASSFVGRGEEIARLMRSWQQAFAGSRSVVLIGGEPGIGKSALIDQFVAAREPMYPAVVGRRQCVQLFRETEPYHPPREALPGLLALCGRTRHWRFEGSSGFTRGDPCSPSRQLAPRLPDALRISGFAIYQHHLDLAVVPLGEEHVAAYGEVAVDFLPLQGKSTNLLIGLLVGF